MMASSKKDLVAALMEMEEALNLRATESETLGAPEAAGAADDLKREREAIELQKAALSALADEIHKQHKK
jgi:hypothetical protein